MIIPSHIESEAVPWVRINSCIVCQGALGQETESEWGELRLYCLSCSRRYKLNGEPDFPWPV